MYKRTLFIFVLILMVVPFSLVAQSKEIQFSTSALNSSSYNRIKNHLEYEVRISLPIVEWISLRPGIGYSQYKHYWNKRDFEYRGTVYTSRNGQLWRNHRLMIDGLIFPSKNFYFGTGTGIEFIYVKRILFPGWTSFWVDSEDIVREAYKEEEEKSKICFTSNLVIGWEQPVWRAISLMLEGKYKFTIVGKKLTDTNDSIVSQFSFYVGIGISFDKD